MIEDYEETTNESYLPTVVVEDETIDDINSVVRNIAVTLNNA
jgi:hypothetical protein